MERARDAEPVVDSPLIRPFERGEMPRGASALRERRDGDGHGILRLEPIEVAAGVRKDRGRSSVDGEPIDGPRLQRRQKDAPRRLLYAGGLHRFGRREADRSRVQGRQPGQALFRRVLRHALEDHDDAGGEPDHEDQAERTPR